MNSSKKYTNKSSSKYPVKSLIKALNILEILGASENGESLTAINKKLNIGKSTVHRLLATLKDHDFVGVDPVSGNYILGAKILQLSEQLTHQSILVRYGEPTLAHLAKKSNETANLGVLEGTEVLYLIKKESDMPLRMSGRVGKRLPAHCTAMGKMLLSDLTQDELKKLYSAENDMPAMTPNSISSLPDLERHLDKVRCQGIAFDNEEMYPGVICVAAPVRDYRGKIIASVSLSLPKHRLDPERLDEFKSLLIENSDYFSWQLGYQKGISGTDSEEAVPPTVPNYFS